MTETDPTVGGWLAGLRAAAYVAVKAIPLAHSREWRLADGRLVHRTGRYFAVTGIAVDDGTAQPLLEQREIGTLGFLRREREGRVELLAQGKIEPGNVGPGGGEPGDVAAAQLAPTLQATASNLDRVHGGRAQFLAELFRDPADSDATCEQSEQGTRFLGKLNRNTLVTGDPDVTEDADLPAEYRWIEVDDVLRALALDNAVNTDARSVLTSSPWHLIAGRTPFAEGQDELAEPLARSYATVRPGALDEVRQVLGRVALAAPGVSHVSVEELPAWRFDAAADRTIDGVAYAVRQLTVESDARETPAWDQPIIDSHGDGYADVDLVVHDGVALVALVARFEPGLLHVAELGPTRVTEPGGGARPWATDGSVVARVRQSDEGGRFYRDVTEYRIVRRREPDPQPDAVLLTLGELQELLLAGGFVTNEARSALSLLLTRL
jgi:oxidase EvaA